MVKGTRTEAGIAAAATFSSGVIIAGHLIATGQIKAAVGTVIATTFGTGIAYLGTRYGFNFTANKEDISDSVTTSESVNSLQNEDRLRTKGLIS